MNSKRFNIVIPSLTLSTELINCLIKFNNQKYKNFFVTIVLDYKNKNKIPKLNYKLNILIVGKRTMSFKRNHAVRKFKSNFIAVKEEPIQGLIHISSLGNEYFIHNEKN